LSEIYQNVVSDVPVTFDFSAKTNLWWYKEYEFSTTFYILW